MLTLYTIIRMRFCCATCCNARDTLYHELQLGKDAILSADHLKHPGLHVLLPSLWLHIINLCSITNYGTHLPAHLLDWQCIARFSAVFGLAG